MKHTCPSSYGQFTCLCLLAVVKTAAVIVGVPYLFESLFSLLWYKYPNMVGWSYDKPVFHLGENCCAAFCRASLFSLVSPLVHKKFGFTASLYLPSTSPCPLCSSRPHGHEMVSPYASLLPDSLCKCLPVCVSVLEKCLDGCSKK